MFRSLRTIVSTIVSVTFFLAFSAVASGENSAVDNSAITDRKIQYAMSEADVFMRTIDDAMRESIVRDVLSEDDEILLAKMLYGEDRENPTYMRAAIIWCVYNRVDAFHKPVSEIVTPAIFPGYLTGNPVTAWAVDLIRDVTIRYVLEQNGFKDVGRVLPREYLWYEQLEGHRDHVFKTTLKLSDPKCIRWDWSLPSPYKE